MGGEVVKIEFSKAIKQVVNPLPGSIEACVKYRLPVKKKYEGLDILTFLSKVLPNVDQRIWLSKIDKGELLLNDQPAGLNTVVKGGNLIEHQSEPQVEPDVSINIELIYQNEKILVINKPAPLPMHPSGRFNKNSLTEILKLAFPDEDYKLIHRLDANTTGVVVLGLKSEFVESIVSQFESKSTKKEYVALVEGIPEKDVFYADDAISETKAVSGSRTLVREGNDAYTEFEVLERRENTTLLKVKPFTGRTNQIRVHLANLGYPIVGDVGYKDLNYFKTNPLTYATDSLCLHAWRLTLEIDGKERCFEAPIPSKFNEL